MADSIGKQRLCKPAKPYPDFPLYAHASGRWAKKIKQRTHFFGKWDDWQGALERFQYENDYLQQGKKPPPRDVTPLNVGELVNTLLAHRDEKVQSGELTKRSFDDYKRTGKMLIQELGRHTPIESLAPADFAKLRSELSARLGLVALGNEIGRVRVFFNFAVKNDLIEHPVKMGVSFDKPNRKSLKKERLAKPEKLFTIDELAHLFRAAKPQMKTFILLGLNGGLGNADIGQMEHKHIKGDWIDYPRPKTLVDRRFPLWDETKRAIGQTKESADSQFVFLTKYGKCWYKDAKDSPLSQEFSKLCKAEGLHVKGRGFYALRHQFRTLADGCRDQVAINYIMGHSDASMAANYRHDIEDERLIAVTEYVRTEVAPIFKKGGAK